MYCHQADLCKKRKVKLRDYEKSKEQQINLKFWVHSTVK